MLTVDVARVSAVLLSDGWHEVRGGIEVARMYYVRGEQELQTSAVGARWVETDGRVVTCPLESIIAVKTWEKEPPA